MSFFEADRMTNTVVNTPVNLTGVLVTNTVANHAKKPKKINGQNFKRWQQKMFFYLTTLNLARFLNKTSPQVEPPKEGQLSNAQAVQAVEAWKHSDFLWHNYVLNVQVARFLLHDIHVEGMSLSEAFQVAAIIKKLPRSWVEFKNYLKHKRKEMSVEDLVICLHIVEDNKLAQKNTYTPDSAKANMVEHVGSSLKSNSKEKGKDKRKNDKKGKGKADYLAPKVELCMQIPKRGKLYRRKIKLNDNMDMIAMVSVVISMIFEVNLVGSNTSSWWVDTGETHHVCADKSMFHSLKVVDNGERLYMGNSVTADIKGEGDVILKMTSEKELKLTNVLYVQKICNNLVFGWLLNKFGFRPIF
ncbi:hypothetical protein Tco_0495697 [Tanacetum coccineum]